MSASNPSPNIRSWALDLDERTVVQASRTARLPILAGPLAFMPDAHVGIGATVGSVIATDGALVPSAVGVDVGCGMIAARTDLTADALPDDLAPLLDLIAATIPAGVGRSHAEVDRRGDRWFAEHPMPEHLNEKQRSRVAVQFATLGSGNHFAELSVDERDAVWFVLHSGSRGIGNELAQGHIKAAKRDFAQVVEGYKLEDPDLAWVVVGTPAFDAYVADLQWLQAYAAGSRDAMMHAALEQLFAYVGHGRELDRVNAHHNYAQLEAHLIDGAPRDVWVTRKGAIRARRRPRDHSRLDGHRDVPRGRARERSVVVLVRARRRPPDVAHPGEARADDRLAGTAHGGQDLAREGRGAPRR